VWQNGKGGVGLPPYEMRVEGLFSSNVLLKGENIISAYTINIIVGYVTLKLYPRLRPCLFLKISVIDMIVGLRSDPCLIAPVTMLSLVDYSTLYVL
jgi:hypothetical protein